MWSNSLIIGLVSGLVGSLITIFLTPWLQHHLWRYQRRAEIRLSAVKEFNHRATEYMTARVFPDTSADAAATWFMAMNVAGADIAVLFSRRTLDAVKRLDSLIDAHNPEFNMEEFVEARDAALRLLYGEIIPLGRWTDGFAGSRK